MSTTLQPCLESQFIQTATVKLKVAPPKTSEFGRSGPCLAADDTNEHREKMEFGGCSFLQVLSNISSTPKEAMEKECVYVHPLAKRYSKSRLSEKSLELCTENLGCETGTDIMDSSILSLSSSCYYTRKSSSASEQEKKHQQQLVPKNKMTTSSNFPPPLTTISGANSIQVKTRREGGRLIIQAVEVPVKRTYLQAERCHGRLRLTLLKNPASFDSELTEEEKEVDNEGADEVDMEHESDLADEDNKILENEEVLIDHAQEDEDDEERDTQKLGKDMDGNNFDIEVEMEMEKFQRPMRCNEGGLSNRRLCNWEPKRLLVTTS